MKTKVRADGATVCAECHMKDSHHKKCSLNNGMSNREIKSRLERAKESIEMALHAVEERPPERPLEPHDKLPRVRPHTRTGEWQGREDEGREDQPVAAEAMSAPPSPAPK